MDPDFRIFIARHFFDFILVIMFAVKVMFVSNADLKTKFIGAVLLFGVISLGDLLQTKMVVGADTSTLSFIAIAIGLRLLALKIIFTVIDAEANV